MDDTTKEKDPVQTAMKSWKSRFFPPNLIGSVGSTDSMILEHIKVIICKSI